jgi:hypothetical protein
MTHTCLRCTAAWDPIVWLFPAAELAESTGGGHTPCRGSQGGAGPDCWQAGSRGGSGSPGRACAGGGGCVAGCAAAAACVLDRTWRVIRIQRKCVGVPGYAVEFDVVFGVSLEFGTALAWGAAIVFNAYCLRFCRVRCGVCLSSVAA